eukprot:7189584-Karenia_brevis.AAC.1
MVPFYPAAAMPTGASIRSATSSTPNGPGEFKMTKVGDFSFSVPSRAGEAFFNVCEIRINKQASSGSM